MLGYPRFLADVSEALHRVNGFCPLIEFSDQKGRFSLARQMMPRVVKGHCLQAKELLVDKRNLWEFRIRRAITKRWVRLIYYQFSPVLSFEENVRFLTKTGVWVREDGFSLGAPNPFRAWEGRRPSFMSKRNWATIRLALVVFLCVLTPVVCIIVMRKIPLKSPLVVFLMIGGICLLVGILSHGLGAFPESVLGLTRLRGVKLLLILPFLFIPGFLLSKEEWKKMLATPLTGWIVLVGAGICLVFLGGTIMRSGNFPVLPVTDAERMFRDTLEEFFGARPRFKEFLIGHPLLLLGLYLQSQERERPQFFLDGRLWVWLGMLGPISILNTFVHFHSPISAGMLRTVHGLWMGFLLSIPLCYFYPTLESLALALKKKIWE